VSLSRRDKQVEWCKDVSLAKAFKAPWCIIDRDHQRIIHGTHID
jgi:hypothetical protein